MLKKSSSNSVKTPQKAAEESVLKNEKPSSKKANKLTNEIDEIFAGKKRKKPEGKKSTWKLNKDETGEPKLVKQKKEKKSKGDTKGGFVDPPARPKNRTEDGLAIYTEDELGISNPDAGNTPLCPFDCSCCF